MSEQDHVAMALFKQWLSENTGIGFDGILVNARNDNVERACEKAFRFALERGRKLGLMQAADWATKHMEYQVYVGCTKIRGCGCGPEISRQLRALAGEEGT